jgi:hypothetical protein
VIYFVETNYENVGVINFAETKSNLAPKAALSVSRSRGHSYQQQQQPTRGTDIVLLSSCTVKQRQGWRLIREHAT